MTVDQNKAPREITCIYCRETGQFPHQTSFAYAGREFSLFRCPNCESLMYDPQELTYTIPKPYTKEYMDATRIACKYYLEVGYSADFVVHCALAAMSGVPANKLKDHLFVDVGAGMGMASYFAKSVRDIEVVVIEPSYSGELGTEMLGMEIHNAYFEDLPKAVTSRLRDKPTLLHLNSVVEHLRDPVAVIRELMTMTEISTIASVVPDGAKIDLNMPFTTQLPYLAPGDHLHLPTVAGMHHFNRNLGFKYSEVRDMGGLLVAIGSKFPIKLPTPEVILADRDRFLRELTKHPNPYASLGATGRMLAGAVCGNDPAFLAELKASLAKFLAPNSTEPLAPAKFTAEAKSAASWYEIPFNMAPIAFWLGADAFTRGQFAEGQAWMDTVEAVADRIAVDFPHFAMESVDLKFEARIHRSHHYNAQAKHAAASAEYWLTSVIGSSGDAFNGPRPDKIQRAKDTLKQFKEG